MFKPRKKPLINLTMSEGGVSMKNVDEDFAAAIVEFWVSSFGGREEPKPRKTGFSTDHMDVEYIDTDTMRTGQDEIEGPDDDDEDDD